MEGYGKRVLVVDDDDVARELLAALLVHAGYNVYMARDGGEGLRSMMQREFHAVVSDNQMSPINGLEFLAMSALAWPEIPVVMVSGDKPDIAEKAMRLGAYAWLQKPYDCHRLLEVVRAAIQSATGKQARPKLSHMFA